MLHTIQTVSVRRDTGLITTGLSRLQLNPRAIIGEARCGIRAERTRVAPTLNHVQLLGANSINYSVRALVVNDAVISHCIEYTLGGAISLGESPFD
jgi:hypothetical protein